MRSLRLFLLPVAASVITAPLTTAAADAANGRDSATPVFSLTPDSGQATVLTWLRELVPDCPPEIAVDIAARFIDDLQRYHPADAERLTGTNFPTREYQSRLLQIAGTRLSGASEATQREAVALRRVQAMLEQDGRPAAVGDGQAIVNGIKSNSAKTYARLVEGKMDDDELRRLARTDRTKDATDKVSASAPPKPKVLSAGEILSEFARRNQNGAAAARLRGYAVESTMRVGDGPARTMLLYKLRPDFFRLQVPADAAQAGFIVGFDGARYWRQTEGTAAILTAEGARSLVHQREFLDLLFEPGDSRSERIEDTVVDGRPCFQIVVKRRDGSGFIAQVDQENYRVLQRYDADGRRIQYSDFREFAGLTLAHREVITQPDGRVTTMEIARIAANPGLVRTFFSPPMSGQPDLFSLEKAVAQATAPAAHN